METASEKIQLISDNIQEKVNGTPVIPDNIEFPEKEDLTGAQRHYHYEQLNNTAKKIYISIENNIDKLKNGEDNIQLPPSLNDDANSSSDGKQLPLRPLQLSLQNRRKQKRLKLPLPPQKR